MTPSYLPRPIVLSCLLALSVLLGSSSLWADEVPNVTPADAPVAAAARLHPNLTPRALDLLPLDDLEREDFNKEHGPLVYRTQAVNRQVQKLDGQLKKLNSALADKKADKKRRQKLGAQRKKAQAQRRNQRLQLSALMARLTNELVADGLPAALIPVMNAAPQGAGRVERHARGLVLMLPDLTNDQWDLFQGIHERTEGALHAIAAQKERTLLALKQTKLEKPQIQAVSATFDQQLRLNNKRYWQLVDFTLNRDQRVALYKMLPQRMKRKDQAKEHLYALPDLTPTQASRLRALLTEIEQESAPDNAAVKRLGLALRKKDMKGS